MGRAPEGLAVDEKTRTVAVATRDPNQLVLFNADSETITGRVPLPGFVRHLTLTAPGALVLAPVESLNARVRVS